VTGTKYDGRMRILNLRRGMTTTTAGGATTNFAGLLKSGSERRIRGLHLLLGPWVMRGQHEKDENRASANLGGAAIDYDESYCGGWIGMFRVGQWVDREKRLRYFVMGGMSGERRRRAPTAGELSFDWVHRRGSTDWDVGAGQAGSGKSTASLFSDPAKSGGDEYALRGRMTTEKWPSVATVLTFDSAELKHDTEVTGRFKRAMFVSLDCRDYSTCGAIAGCGGGWKAFNLMIRAGPFFDELSAICRAGGSGWSRAGI